MAQTDIVLKTVVDGADKASAELSKLNNAISSQADEFKKAGAAVTAFGVGLGVMIKGWVSSAADFEQTKISFTTMLGSGDKANVLLKDLAAFASKTPFTLKGIEQNSKLLMAMGIESKDLLPTLKSLGDVSAGLSVDLERVALNFGQVKTQGKLTGVELRDFLRAGIPLLEELSKNMGKTTAEIKQMVSDGAVSFDDVNKAFQTMTGEGGKFNNLMIEQSKSLNGQLSNLGDSIELLARDMGQALLPVVGFISEKFAELVNWFKELSPETKKIISIVTALTAALALIAGPILLLIGFLPAIAAGWALVSASMAPILLTVAAIVAALGALYLAWDSNFLGIQDITKTVVSFLSEKFKSFVDAIAAIANEIALTYDIISSNFNEFWAIYGEQVKAALSALTAAFGFAWEGIKAAFKLLWEAIKLIFNVAWAYFSGIVKMALALLQGDWQKAWDAFAGIFKNIWGSLQDFAKGVMGAIGGYIDGMIQKALDLISNLKQAIGLTDSVPTRTAGVNKNGFSGTKARANGGPVDGGSSYLVGERGPEIFTPNINGAITPNNKIGQGITINISGVFGSDAAGELGDMIINRLKLVSAI